jgi:hypothetical protein
MGVKGPAVRSARDKGGIALLHTGIQRRPSYVAALTEAEQFGWQLWAEACRCGLTDKNDVVVVGDGAHWIWNVAQAHVLQATQILDWYHASEYVWNAATAIFGEASPERKQWAKVQLDALWEGKGCSYRLPVCLGQDRRNEAGGRAFRGRLLPA